MTSRQARTERREADRKAKKAAYKASISAPAAFEDDFSPEFIAQARTAREPIPALQQLGFVSQSAGEPAKTRGDHAAYPSVPKTRQRAEINRANSLHSTGPCTPQGRSASSRNALKHGLASGQLIIPGEDRAAFEALLQALLDDHQPANTTEGAHRRFGGRCARSTIEQMLIQEMAQSYWLAQRALRLQNECFTVNGIDEKRLALFLRYHTTHERAFHKALNTLIRLQQSRAREQAAGEVGFVSQPRASTDPKIGFVSQTSAPAAELPPPSGLEHVEERLENDQSTSQAA